MSTALSWTEWRTAREDLSALLAFRRSGLSEKASRRLRVGGGIVLGLTLAALVVPAYTAGVVPRPRGGQVLALLPTLLLGFLTLTTFSAVAAGGGREVVPRDQATPYPVSSLTEHLGALLLAPLNIAWLVQSWTLLGATAYALGPQGHLLYLVPVLLWIVASTAIAQALGWLAEGVRRGPHGIAVFRCFVAVLAVVLAVLVVTHRLTPLLDHSPTVPVLTLVLAISGGQVGTGLLGVLVLLALLAAAVVVGALPARWALERPMREELRLESGHHSPRRVLGSDLAMMVRTDRAAIWRSVPLRRGVTVLAVLPGMVALGGDLPWRTLTILPGLVASGAALLFGVNTWCLDGRGALWRDSLPVAPAVAFWSRVVVLLEVLVGAAVVTIVLATLRAGLPTLPELVALLCATVSVSLQVVSAAMRWSIARPLAVDLRSARATPAPPVVMAGYSARLALATTLTGLLYSALAQVSHVLPRESTWLSLFFLLLLGLVSGVRLLRSRRRWDDPVVRARVVATVVG